MFSLRIFLTLWAFFLGLLCNICATVVPTNKTQVEAYLKAAEMNVSNRIQQLVTIPDSQKTFDNTLRAWNRLGSEITENFALLSFVSQTSSPARFAAMQAMQALQSFLTQTIHKTPLIYQSLIAYTESALNGTQPLSSYECNLQYAFLSSALEFKNQLPKQTLETLNKLRMKCATRVRSPFYFIKSRDSSSLAERAKSLSIFSLNTCFLPPGQSLIYGGMAPWYERVVPLAQKILSVDADLVCLQEVFVEDASDALFEALKDRYCYFYTCIGPRAPGIAFEGLGLPSGLFVASKYPLENPQFTLFSAAAYQMNFGLFDFVLKKNALSSHIYVSHLQALNYPQIRALQLKEALEKMQQDLSKTENEKMAFILCGDLNIPWGSQEPAEALIRTHFTDSYNQNRKKVSEADRTCTDYFTHRVIYPQKPSRELDPNFQILDYTLLLDSPLCSHYVMKTELVRMNTLDKPEAAISDHHGLFTTIEEPLLERKEALRTPKTKPVRFPLQPHP